MRVPDFIIIGAQKGGTTSLFNYLKQHSKILLPDQKEIHFFDKHYEKGTDWYLQKFPVGGFKTGEASPYYMYHPHVAGRIAKHFPDIKLIVLLRNPADRAYAHFIMEKQRNRESLPTFEAAIKAEPERLKKEKERLAIDPLYLSPVHQHHSYLDRGNYHSQLINWFKHFPQKNFLFMKSEYFFQHTQKALDTVFAFLGLSTEKILDLKTWRQNHYPPMNSTTRDFLTEYFVHENQKLADLIGGQFDWNNQD